MPAADVSQRLTEVFDGLAGFSRVAVAVSGGSDSMALLRLVLAWRGQRLGPADVQALTFDHGLRLGSAEEALQVKRWCDELDTAHATLKWTGPPPLTAIQAKARQARYDALTQWCRDNHVPVLMTGHTADDQAETVAMRLKRTSSDRSLAGIWRDNEWRGVKLLRPLLGLRRAELRTYLEACGQGYLDDPSNENEAFERVRVRKALKSADVDRLQERARSAQLRVLDLESKVRLWLKAWLDVDDFAVMRISRKALFAEGEPMQAAVLRALVMIGGDGGSPEPATIEALQGWIGSGQTSRRSLNGAIVSARRHVVEIMREPARIADRFLPVSDSGWLTFDGRFDVRAPVGAKVGPMGVPPLVKRWKDVPALAFSALPCVKLPDGQLVSAVKSGIEGVSATLCERFRL